MKLKSFLNKRVLREDVEEKKARIEKEISGYIPLVDVDAYSEVVDRIRSIKGYMAVRKLNKSGYNVAINVEIGEVPTTNIRGGTYTLLYRIPINRPDPLKMLQRLFPIKEFIEYFKFEGLKDNQRKRNEEYLSNILGRRKYEYEQVYTDINIGKGVILIPGTHESYFNISEISSMARKEEDSIVDTDKFEEKKVGYVGKEGDVGDISEITLDLPDYITFSIDYPKVIFYNVKEKFLYIMMSETRFKYFDEKAGRHIKSSSPLEIVIDDISEEEIRTIAAQYFSGAAIIDFLKQKGIRIKKYTDEAKPDKEEYVDSMESFKMIYDNLVKHVEGGGKIDEREKNKLIQQAKIVYSKKHGQDIKDVAMTPEKMAEVAEDVGINKKEAEEVFKKSDIKYDPDI